MVLTEADTAVAREWDNPRLLLRNFSAESESLRVLCGTQGDGRNEALLIHPWLLQDPDYMQALSSEHPSDHHISGSPLDSTLRSGS